MSNLSITVPKSNEYSYKQCDYNHLPKIPFRMMLNGPSNSGKTILIINLILKFYRNLFSKVYIFSPSIYTDSSFQSIIEYIEKYTDKGINSLHDKYETDILQDIINNQVEEIKHIKNNTKKKILPSILIVIDDCIDNKDLVRNSSLLKSIFIRHRHSGISIILSSQSYTSISPVIRSNLSSIIVFRIRDKMDLENILLSISALIDYKTLLKIYHRAVYSKYSFMYINLLANDINDMFYLNFNSKFLISD